VFKGGSENPALDAPRSGGRGETESAAIVQLPAIPGIEAAWIVEQLVEETHAESEDQKYEQCREQNPEGKPEKHHDRAF
jgi:hypothetical protein